MSETHSRTFDTKSEQSPHPVLDAAIIVACLLTLIPTLRSAAIRGVKHSECSKDSASIFAAIDDLAERLTKICDMGARQ